MHSDLIALAGKTVDRITDRDARRGADAIADGPAAFADMLAADPVTPAAARDTRDADAKPADHAKADAAAGRQDEAEQADPALGEISDQTTAGPEAHHSTGSTAHSPAATGSEAAGAGSPAATEAKPLAPSASSSVPPVPATAAPSVAASIGAAPSPAVGSSLAALPGVDPSAAAGLAAPPSAQAADLARILATGTRVSVTQTTSASQAIVPPLGGDSIVVLAGGGEARSTNGAAQRGQAPGPAPLFAAVTTQPGAPSLAEALSSASRGTPGSSDSGPIPLSGKAAELASGVPADLIPGAAAPSPATTPTAAAPPPSTLASAAGEPATAANTNDKAGLQPGDPQAAGLSHTPVPAASAQPAPTATLRAPAGEADLPPPPAAGQVSVHIAKAVQTGVDRIEIQLSPASLGRVEVRLDIADHHHVKVAISADTPDALDALRADGRLLERALHDAGLKTEPGSLSFHLRDPGSRPGSGGGSGGGHQARDDGQSSGHRSGVAAIETDPPSPLPPPSTTRRAGGIDIRA